ncbi:mitochondrial intermediate peptidase [Lanmaoa asiatica]|nr:mitochondrial intermediate peptidase [Lanmaoa asiatica]
MIANAFRKVSRPTRSLRGRPRTLLSLHRRATTTIPPSPDDAELVSLFDQPQNGRQSRPLSVSGILQHPELTTPAAFNALAESTILRAQLLTERILRANQSRSELSKVVKNLDRLSDLLCGVIDFAELLRNAHPDSQWVQCANDSYEKLCEYMNVLNTHILRTVLHDPEVVQSLSQEAYQTALIFWRDFEKSAIKLPPEQRERFVSLSSEILSLGHEFVTQASAPRPPAVIEPSELDGLKDEGMGARLRRQAWSTQKSLLVYPGSHQAYMIMSSAPNESPRQKLYLAAHTSSQRQIECLEQLLHARAELARLVGWDSYAGMTLNDKMAKTPENVRQFLDTFLDRKAIHARSALHTLRLRKQSHLNTRTLPIIQAWDRSFYCPPEPPEPPVSLSPLSLGRVFMGLSRLFKHLYGISLRPAEVASGEVWHSDVHKLEVVDEDSGSHRMDICRPFRSEREVVRRSPLHGTEEFLAPSRSFEAVKRHRLRGMRGEYQLPLVVLLCEFTRPTIARGPTFLEWHEVQTLFHEMGHAMHSMIGRTEYHNVAGTRCATDFVELPSILMEYFLNSPKGPLPLRSGRFLDFKSDWQPPPRSMYHSPAVLEPGFDSTAALANLYNTRGLIPHAAGTSFQTQFGHLYGYGATYYSYLFDRAIASHVWRKVFSTEPLNRELGEKYKAEILRYGGGKDPWQMLGALLDAPHLQVGDEEAMREVGRWRVEDGPVSERH